MAYISNANYILFSHVVRIRMFCALEQLCAYKKNPKDSLEELIDAMYNKMWTFHVTYTVSIMSCQ